MHCFIGDIFCYIPKSKTKVSFDIVVNSYSTGNLFIVVITVNSPELKFIYISLSNISLMSNIYQYESQELAAGKKKWTDILHWQDIITDTFASLIGGCIGFAISVEILTEEKDETGSNR